MDTKRRIYVAIRGGLFFATVGPVIAGLLLGIAGFFKSTPESTEILKYVVSLPYFMMLIALITAPFALVAGAGMTWWLAGRSRQAISNRKLYIESAGMGALAGVLSCPYTLVIIRPQSASHWLETSWPVLSLASGAGLLCAFVLAWLTRRESFRKP